VISKVPSFFAFSLPKAGSTLLDQVLKDISSEAGISYFAPTNDLFRLGKNINFADFDVEILYRSEGYCFSGFREFPHFLSRYRLSGRKALLLLRDPRDILTSLYFSTAITHSPPGQGSVAQAEFLKQRKQALEISIDDFVMSRVLTIEALLDRYIQNLPEMDVRIYRYEDIIFRKHEWLRDIVDFIGIAISQEAIARIAARHDQQPPIERPDQHVRQVQPGDHRRKLHARGREFLEANLSPRWKLLGYPFERARADVFLPREILRRMPDPREGWSVTARVIDNARVRQIEPAFLRRTADCVIDPSRGAEFLGLWLEDENGAACRKIQAGAHYTIACILHVEGHLGKLSLGVRIADAAKNGIAGINTRLLPLKTGSWPAGTLVEIRWKTKAPARAGDYLFSCGCALESEPGVFAARHLDGYMGCVSG